MLSIDWKALGESAGVVATLTSVYLTGQGRKSGPLIGIAGFVPWTIFAVCTHSWLMIPQNAVIVAVNAWNLWKSPVFRRRSPPLST